MDAHEFSAVPDREIVLSFAKGASGTAAIGVAAAASVSPSLSGPSDSAKKGTTSFGAGHTSGIELSVKISCSRLGSQAKRSTCRQLNTRRFGVERAITTGSLGGSTDVRECVSVWVDRGWTGRASSRGAWRSRIKNNDRMKKKGSND